MIGPPLYSCFEADPTPQQVVHFDDEGIAAVDKIERVKAILEADHGFGDDEHDEKGKKKKKKKKGKDKDEDKDKEETAESLATEIGELTEAVAARRTDPRAAAETLLQAVRARWARPEA